MNVSGVRVRIYDEGECIHEYEAVRSGGNDLKTLMCNLRDVHSEINDFLTALIQRRDASVEAQETSTRSSSSDIESDSVDEEEEMNEGETRDNPKKCKLSI